MKLADKLFELRKEKGWSQEKLAEQINVSHQSIYYKLFTLQDVGLIVVGFIAAFLAGLLAIKSLLKFVSSKNYIPFAYYRIVFGGLILLTSYMG